MAKKEAFKRGMMEGLLSGERRLDGFEESWIDATFNDILTSAIGGGTPSRAVEEFWGGDIFWMTVKDFTSFSSFTTEERITKDGLSQSSSNLVPAGTLILATRIALGRCAIYDIDVAINQDLKALYFKDSCLPLYFKYWFDHNIATVIGLGSGSTVLGISLPDLRKLELPLPTLPEQHAIATLISDLDAELSALRARRVKLGLVKGGMMEVLLSGAVRLV